jgi:hypothetical protein
LIVEVVIRKTMKRNINEKELSLSLKLNFLSYSVKLQLNKSSFYYFGRKKVSTKKKKTEK